MNEKKLIFAAAALGAFALFMLILVLQPFSRFEEEYPMTVASGSAADAEPGEAEDEPDTSPAPAASDVPAPAGEGVADVPEVSDSVTGIPLVHAQGGTLETRIDPPTGFTRTPEEKDSLGTFLREFAMKKDGAPVLS